MSVFNTAVAQIGKSVTAAQNFVLRTLLDGAFRVTRGNWDALGADVFRIEANNDITLAGNLLTGALGAGQTWQNVVASRAFGVTYTNTTGKPIQLNVVAGPASGANVTILVTVSGVLDLYGSYSGASGQFVSSGSVVVPTGATYMCSVSNGTATLSSWRELR